LRGVRPSDQLQHSAASGPSDKDLDAARHINGLLNEFYTFFEHIKFAFLIPFSWCLTICHFILVLNWRILVSAQGCVFSKRPGA
jgi:hypothetical protein